MTGLDRGVAGVDQGVVGRVERAAARRRSMML